MFSRLNLNRDFPIEIEFYWKISVKRFLTEELLDDLGPGTASGIDIREIATSDHQVDQQAA